MLPVKKRSSAPNSFRAAIQQQLAETPHASAPA